MLRKTVRHGASGAVPLFFGGCLLTAHLWGVSACSTAVVSPQKKQVLPEPERTPVADHQAQLRHRYTFWKEKYALSSPITKAGAVANGFAAAALALGKALEDTGLAKESLRISELALRENPRDTGALINKAGVHYWMHDFMGARKVALEVLGIHPFHGQGITLMGDTAFDLGRLHEAERWYRHLQVEARGFAIDLRMARLAAARGNPEAEALFQKAYVHVLGQAPPERAWYLTLWGNARLDAGDRAGAEILFQQAHAAAPDDPEPLILLGMLLETTDRLKAAETNLADAAALGDHPDATAVLIRVYEKTGRIDAAGALRGELREQIVRLLKEDRDVWLGHVGWIAFQTWPGELWSQALVLDAFKQRPSLRNALWLIEVKLRQGKTQEAWHLLQAAYRGDERSAGLVEVAAKVYPAVGRVMPVQASR